jgi:hypothetical protein
MLRQWNENVAGSNVFYPSIVVLKSEMCMAPAPSSISSAADCIPVVGAIHLYLSSTDDDGFLNDPNTKISIESGFQRLIRFGMQEGLYISGDVARYVSFIGTRIYAGHEAPPNANLEGGSGSNGEPALRQEESNRVAIIIGVVGVLVVVVLSWMLLSVRGQRNAIAAVNGNVDGLQGDDSVLTSLPTGIADEENPYVTAKSIVNGPRVLPSMVTVGTMVTDVDEEDAEAPDIHEEKSLEGQSVTSCSDNETCTTGELKIFQDNEEDEEEEKQDFFLPSRKKNGQLRDLFYGRTQDEAPQAIAETNANPSNETVKAGTPPVSDEAEGDDN